MLLIFLIMFFSLQKNKTKQKKPKRIKELDCLNLFDEKKFTMKKKNHKSDCRSLFAKNFDMKLILIISYLYYMLLN